MDTIVYKIHNVSSYTYLMEAITDIKKIGKGLVKVPQSENQAMNFDEGWMNLKMGTLFFFNYNIKADLPSSATGVIITHVSQENLCKIEFSIPKYFFANNVCEVIPSYHSKYYKASNQSISNLCAKFWMKVIHHVIYRIIGELTEGTQTDVKKTDIEISRLDISFNQIFHTLEDALFYFDSMKRVRLKKSTDRSFVHYDGTFTYKNPRYYYKVYHKGTEFTKNGYNDIYRNYETYYKEKKQGNETMLELSNKNLDSLSKYADRILRYELECKAPLMAYMFNTRLKKKNLKLGVNKRLEEKYTILCHLVEYLNEPQNLLILRHLKEKYTNQWGVTFNTYQKDYVKKRYYLPESMQENQLDEYTVTEVQDPEKIDHIDRILKRKRLLAKYFDIHTLDGIKQAGKFVTREQSKEHRFFLAIAGTDAAKAVDFQNVHDDKGNLLPYLGLWDETEIPQLFSIDLLKVLIAKFNGMFDQLQFAELPHYNVIKMKVDEHNYKNDTAEQVGKKKRKYGIQSSNVEMILELLKHYTWDELKKTGRYDPKTIYNWKKKIAAIEGTETAHNYMQADFMNSVVRDLSRIYHRHYHLIDIQDSPLGQFLNKQNQLLEI